MIFIEGGTRYMITGANAVHAMDLTARGGTAGWRRRRGRRSGSRILNVNVNADTNVTKDEAEMHAAACEITNVATMMAIASRPRLRSGQCHAAEPSCSNKHGRWEPNRRLCQSQWTQREELMRNNGRLVMSILCGAGDGWGTKPSGQKEESKEGTKMNITASASARRINSDINVFNGPGVAMTMTYAHDATNQLASRGIKRVAMICTDLSVDSPTNPEQDLGADTRDLKLKWRTNMGAATTADHKTYSCTALNGKEAKGMYRVTTVALLISDLNARHANTPTTWPLRPRADWARGETTTAPLLGKTDLKRGKCRNPRAEPSSSRCCELDSGIEMNHLRESAREATARTGAAERACHLNIGKGRGFVPAQGAHRAIDEPLETPPTFDLPLLASQLV